MDEQVAALQAQLEQKQNEIDNLVGQVQLLGAFRMEALNSRDKIAELEARLA